MVVVLSYNPAKQTIDHFFVLLVSAAGKSVTDTLCVFGTVLVSVLEDFNRVI